MGNAMLQSLSQQTNGIFHFSKILFYQWIFYSANLSLHNFFLSLLLLFDLSQAFFNTADIASQITWHT